MICKPTVGIEMDSGLGHHALMGSEHLSSEPSRVDAILLPEHEVLCGVSDLTLVQHFSGLHIAYGFDGVVREV